MNGMPDIPDDAPCGPLALVVVVLCKDCERWEIDGDNRFKGQCNTSGWGDKAEISWGYDGGELYTAPDFFCAYGTLRATKTREADMK